jgi:hypothetical protein
MRRRIALALLALVLAACTTVTTDGNRQAALNREQTQVGDQQVVYTRNQPPPFFNWSLQRHMLIELYKAQNNATATYSYVVSEFNSDIIFECPSIGFPLAGGTSLTNPQQVVNSGYREGWSETIGQAEPNGTYPPEESLGTYIMCLNDDGSVSPTYVENNVLAFTQPMKIDGKRLVPAGGKNSVRIPVRNSEVTTAPPPSATAPVKP